jgi:hypothetical protein
VKFSFSKADEYRKANDFGISAMVLVGLSLFT